MRQKRLKPRGRLVTGLSCHILHRVIFARAASRYVSACTRTQIFLISARDALLARLVLLGRAGEEDRAAFMRKVGGRCGGGGGVGSCYLGARSCARRGAGVQRR